MNTEHLDPKSGHSVGASWSGVARGRDRDGKDAIDGSTFDRLVRRISAEGSRRGLFRSAVAGTLAGLGLTSVLGGEHAEAKSCQKKCNKKNSSSARKKCKKKCKNIDTDTIALRQPCTKDSQCVGSLLCQAANSQNSCPGQESGTFCCVETEVQAPCDTSCDCCGIDVICNGGYCDNA